MIASDLATRTYNHGWRLDPVIRSLLEKRGGDPATKLLIFCGGEVAGRPAVRLSDNAARVSGASAEVEHYRRVFAA